MNRDVALNWVDALRSEHYKQGKGRLCYGDSYCCFGVLCEVLGVNGDYRSCLGWPNLVDANDGGATFLEIADWIEQNWDRL